ALKLVREPVLIARRDHRRRQTPGEFGRDGRPRKTRHRTRRAVGVVGEDDPADQLRAALAARDVDTTHVLTDPARPTTVKMRVMAHMGLRFPQQVARLDTLSREPIDEAVAASLLAALRSALAGAGALLLSDYRSGVLTPALVAAAQSLADATGVPLTADAQGEFDKYRGAALVKCNAAEAAAYLDTLLTTDSDYAAAARSLVDQLSLSVGMVVTRGSAGSTLATADGDVHHLPAPSVTDVFDTVGAGDTAIAVTTLALTVGAPPKDAVTLANYASGLVVRRVGNYTPSAAELRNALMSN
ncbi:MAG: PfkB family carbohydrate kinase, partial [Chloroflexota bacterium]